MRVRLRYRHPRYRAAFSTRGKQVECFLETCCRFYQPALLVKHLRQVAVRWNVARLNRQPLLVQHCGLFVPVLAQHGGPEVDHG